MLLLSAALTQLGSGEMNITAFNYSASSWVVGWCEEVKNEGISALLKLELGSAWQKQNLVTQNNSKQKISNTIKIK